jgi:hypothetical protein
MNKFHSRNDLLEARASLPLWALVIASMGCNESTRAGRNAAPLAQGAGGDVSSPGDSVPLRGSGSAGSGSAGSGSAGSGSTGSGSAGSGNTQPAGSGDSLAAATGDPGGGNAGVSGGSPSDGGGGVVLTAIVVPVTPDGALGIAAEWSNGTDQSIFLAGCSTVDGWYLQGGEWQKYGAFASCVAEGNAVEVRAGETYVDRTGAAPPPAHRGSNVWRLVGKYGVDCRSGAPLGASECSELHELTSVNQVPWAP